MKEIDVTIKNKTMECLASELKIRTLTKELEHVRKLHSLLEKKVSKLKENLLDKVNLLRKMVDNNKLLREKNTELKKYNKDVNLLREKNRQAELSLKRDESQLKIAEIYKHKEINKASIRSK